VETSLLSAIARDACFRQDGGARRDRTDDLMLAKHALYQLSYGPSSLRRPAQLGAVIDPSSARPRVTQLVVWWAQADSNRRPHAYQACALTS
jgi:hypothetical protein